MDAFPSDYISSMMSSLGALDQSLTLLRKYVEEIVQRNELINQVLVPLFEHTVKVQRLAKSQKSFESSSMDFG